MATPKPFREAAFLHGLEHGPYTAAFAGIAGIPPLVEDDGTALTATGRWLAHLLTARRATGQAAFDTEVAADELRRYQKFARPGQPSPHTVQLRQRQAAARQASVQAKQALLKAAVEFVREAGLQVPPRVTLEAFVGGWIDAHVPKDA